MACLMSRSFRSKSVLMGHLWTHDAFCNIEQYNEVKEVLIR